MDVNGFQETKSADRIARIHRPPRRLMLNGIIHARTYIYICMYIQLQTIWKRQVEQDRIQPLQLIEDSRNFLSLARSQDTRLYFGRVFDLEQQTNVRRNEIPFLQLYCTLFTVQKRFLYCYIIFNTSNFFFFFGQINLGYVRLGISRSCFDLEMKEFSKEICNSYLFVSQRKISFSFFKSN